MRITKTSRVVSAVVMTTVATATVVTFARGDEQPTTSASALPAVGDDAPRVSADGGLTGDPTPSSSASPDSDDATDPDDTPSSPTDEPAAPGEGSGGVASEPSTSGTDDRPAPAPTTAPPSSPAPEPQPEPQPEPEPSPTPAPQPPKKNLLEVLLGL